MLTGSEKVNYGQLDALLKIKGLQRIENPQTTEAVHRKCMKCYPKIFKKEKVVLPGIPEKRTKGVHACNFKNDKQLSGDSYKIGLNKMKSPQKFRSASPEFPEKLHNLIKILKKIPILRTAEEHETIYKTMKLIPDVCSQLSDAELKELSTTVIGEHWGRGNKVDGSQGFFAILKGSIKTHSTYYKRMIGGYFVEAAVQSSAPNLTESSSQAKLGVGDCFGTLIPLPARLQQDVLAVITDESSDFLKIPSADYLRIREEIAKREKLAKEELIRGSPYYQSWPMVFIFHLTAQLKWRTFPTDHVFVKVGEISKYVGFIKSGCCNAYRIIPALVKRPLGKMIKRMRQILIGQLQPTESFGEVSILLQIPSTYMLKAATPVELGMIDAADILELDPIIQMLLLQTSKPLFENITEDMILKEVLFYNGIIPGVGKWVHEPVPFRKDEKKYQVYPHVASYRT
ncbi:cyclic nucleotide-binding domain-containing protein 1 isoform X2 [Hemicordylus capensis]|uniref:cyclic nucleotide-binding domain-containing protein 1 isoform X2 n=1 Tax=Hemicordylus capensis TaxID=884348 RepID=UPI0023026C42|nr:cyclic nucleotide-binding domain-containing protein 1 isoform X2 [Hemicordylus capensis]